MGGKGVMSMMTKLKALSILQHQTPCQAFCKQDLINCYNAAREGCGAIVQMTGSRVREVA